MSSINFISFMFIHWPSTRMEFLPVRMVKQLKLVQKNPSLMAGFSTMVLKWGVSSSIRNLSYSSFEYEGVSPFILWTSFCLDVIAFILLPLKTNRYVSIALPKPLLSYHPGGNCSNNHPVYGCHISVQSGLPLFLFAGASYSTNHWYTGCFNTLNYFHWHSIWPYRLHRHHALCLLCQCRWRIDTHRNIPNLRHII